MSKFITKERTCFTCNKLECMSEFYRNKSEYLGRSFQCKLCAKEASVTYRRTFSGFLVQMYSKQKRSSRDRGHPPPTYTKGELKGWLLNQPNLDELFRIWREDGYSSASRPSVDRLDDNIGYRLDNIQLISWKENNQKNGTDSMQVVRATTHRGVVQLDLDLNLVAKYPSIAIAGRAVGTWAQNIGKCCKGKLVTAKGFFWCYDTDYVEDTVE